MTGELFWGDFSLGSCVWQSTIFAVIGLVSSFILRHRSARAHQVLFLSMIAAVIVPIMSLLVKHWQLGVFIAEPAAAQLPGEDGATAGDYGASGIISVEPPEHKLAPVADDVSPVTAASQSAEMPWGSVLLYGWIAASVILVTRLVATFVLGVRLLDLAVPLDCERIKEAAHLAKSRLGIDNDVKVCSSRGVRSPVTWCWRRRPVLLVPSAAGRFNNGIDWVSILCHELSHWRRRDHISGLLAELVVCILPWHPLLWLAKRRLVSLSEQACDDWVVAIGRPSADYAESLLDLTPAGQVAFVPAVVSSRKGLAHRVHRILKDSCGNPRTGAVWALAVSIIMTCFAVGVAFAQTRPAPAETTPKHEEKLTKSLYKAAAEGDIEKVKLLIAQGVDVSGGEAGWSPLHEAVEQGQYDVAELLIAKGADVNKKDEGGYTPLHYAIWDEDEYLTRLLIAKGADINAESNDGQTPLYCAAKHAKGLVDLLVAEGASLSTIHLAACAGDLARVKSFMKEGIGVNRKDRRGYTPLHYAVFTGQRDIGSFLISNGADVNARSEKGWPSLHYAARYGHKDVAELLLASDADMNAKDKRGWTPLHLAAYYGRREVSRLLIDKGADVNAKNNYGYTPADAALREHKELVELLFAKGAHASSIHLAASVGGLTKVKAFLHEGIDVNKKDMHKHAPLHYAARDGHKEIVELLLANGADVNARAGGDGGTPAEFAMGGNHNEIVKLLVSKGADISPLHLAIHMVDATKARSLIEGGADVNKRTPYGTTPLHRAARAGFKDIAKLLIDKGADVNAKDNWSWTPLHDAAEEGHKDAAELLIANGANVNARSGPGGRRTPLRYAQRNGHSEIVELLLKHGAKK